MVYPIPTNTQALPFIGKVLEGFKNEEYISGQILPTVKISGRNALIPAWGNDHLRSVSSKRAIGDASRHVVEFRTAANKNINIERYDSEFDLDVAFGDIYGSEAFNIEMSISEMLYEQTLLNQELSLAAALTTTATFGTNFVTPANIWTNTALSTPLTDVLAAKEVIRTTSGRVAKYAWMNQKVLNALQVHPDVTALFGTVNASIGQSDVVAKLEQYFGFKKIYVGTAIQNTSAVGQADVLADSWGSDFGIFHKPETPGIFQNSFGYRFELAQSGVSVVKRPHYKQPTKFVTFQVDTSYEDNILNPTAAYLLKTVV